MSSYLNETGLAYLIGKIKTGFISTTDTTAATTVSIETSPTNNSSNLVTSGGVYTALSGKQDIIDSSHKLSADLISDGTTNKVFTASEKTKLSNIAAGAEVNVQANWNETNTSSDSYILNKPTIPTLVKSDWNESDSTSDSYILNKNIVTDELSYLRNAYNIFMEKYDDHNYVIATALTDLDSRITTLDNKPSGVKSDWNETNTTSYAYIQNKPTKLSQFTNDVGYLTSSDISSKANASDAIGSLSLSLNQSSYVITLSGTYVNGTAFTVSDQIDLPLESVVVDGNYNDSTKKVELILKSGSTVEFSVADLVNGLQSEITSENKLSGNLIEDGTISYSQIAAIIKTSYFDKATTALQGITVNNNAVTPDANNIVNLTIPAQTTVDWNETDSTSAAYILNKNVVNDELAYLRSAYNIFMQEYEEDNYVIATAITDLDSRITTLDSNSFSGNYNDLTNKPTIPTLVKSDWNVSDTTSYAYILNKPSIPTLVKSDWNETDTSSFSYIDNKPTIPQGLPAVSAADNGKILMVINGAWTLVAPSYLYSGLGVPNNAQGNNGDLYMQTD